MQKRQTIHNLPTVTKSTTVNTTLIVIAMIAALLCAACSSRPDNVLAPEPMARLLADVHKAEGVIETNPRSYMGDSTKRALRQMVYSSHGYTTDQVDTSLAWYGYHMEKYIEVYDRVIELLEADLAKAQERVGSTDFAAIAKGVPMEGDSVNVWTGVNYRRLASTMPLDNMMFYLGTDRFWEMGDVYTLRAKLIDTNGPVTVNMAVDYGDGQRDYLSQRLNGDGWYTIVFPLDSARAAQRVYGSIVYPVDDYSKVAFIDSISLYRTRWNGMNRTRRSELNTMKFRP